MIFLLTMVTSAECLETLEHPRAINTVKKLRKSQRPEYLKYIEDMK